MPRHDPKIVQPRIEQVVVRVVFCEVCDARIIVCAFMVSTFHHTGQPRQSFACGKCVDELYKAAVVEYAMIHKGATDV